jgi:hypothetical protein
VKSNILALVGGNTHTHTHTHTHIIYSRISWLWWEGTYIYVQYIQSNILALVLGNIYIYVYYIQSNILALVGGNPSPPGFSSSTIVLWDDDLSAPLWEVQV